MKLKICGMKHPANIEEISKIQPDFMGFIFYDKSSRFIQTPIPDLPESIKKVGVFVNAPEDEIIKTVFKQHLQVVQLHGDESSDFCNLLKKDLPHIEIIKVFSVLDTFDFDALMPYERICDYFLFDTKGKLPGGNGETFNWDVLKQYPSKTPFFLSGGIGLDEIQAIKDFMESDASTYCVAIDVNSKFETEPGLKNPETLQEFKTKLFTNTPQNNRL